MSIDKFVTKDYLLDQFEGYDREIASNKYVSFSALANKQDLLTPGTGISIENNVISVTDNEDNVNISVLKNIVANSIDFTDFQTRIANL